MCRPNRSPRPLKRCADTPLRCNEGVLLQRQAARPTSHSEYDLAATLKGIEPEGYVLYTYAAMQVFAQAATTAGSTDLDKVLKVMTSYVSIFSHITEAVECLNRTFA